MGYLKNFLEIGLNETSDIKLKTRCKKLEKMIQEYFNFNFEMTPFGKE
jgi:hypothetical protein